MEASVNAFDLSPEQQDTLALLQRLLGKAIADRYADFCRLAAGAFELNVARPIAAHALRELDSMLRRVLEVPMEAKATEDQDAIDNIEKAKQQLIALGFDESAIRRAEGALKPRFSHKTQIRKIVARLGLAPDGDVANSWTSLCDSFGKAHQRSFHHSLRVDEEFRTQYQQPFDTVIRAVAVALQGRYVSLMRRVEELAAMPDRAQAIALFANEIPGALPLQWHFFRRLQTGDWLSHLARERLLGEPLAVSHEEAGEGMRFRQWPAGDYLLRMAESHDRATRKGVIDALRNVASSKHPDIHHDGMEVLAALPADEAAPLADVAVGWLSREDQFPFLQAPEKLLKKLAEGNQTQAALCVARALLQIWDQNGEIVSLYSRHMYEHHLPSSANALTRVCGEDALRLLIELLEQAAAISGREQYGYYSSDPIANDERAQHNIYDGLLSAVRRSADSIVSDDATKMRGVIALLTRNSSKVFVRLALHVLSRNPAAAPDLAGTYLLNPEMIEPTWCQHEYASLALAWFPSLSPRQQESILAVIDSLPDKYRASWRARFEEHTKAPPTADNERIFNSATVRDAVWKWRSVLPLERQEIVECISRELGDPDSWRQRLFPPEESPLTSADFSAQAISDTVAFLKSWHPEAGPQRQTVTALAQELRTAVSNDPDKYAAEAERFIDTKPIYIRRVLESLQNVVSNRRNFNSGSVLKLVEFAFAQLHRTIDPSTVAEGDDEDWTWASKAAAELLAAGLRRGADGIGFEHATIVQSLVLTFMTAVPRHPELEDFEDRFQREPFFASEATLRGIAVELCILLVFWLSKDTSTPIGAAPRQAIANLPEVRTIFDNELADHSPSGRIPRAIMGRYLGYLLYFGEDWLKSQMGSFFPLNDDALRQSAWLSHLGFGRGPIMELMPDLHQCYAEEIARAATGNTQADRDFRQDNLSDHLVILYLWGGLPDDLLQQFWAEAPLPMRQRAMWFLGTQLALPDLTAEVRARGLLYWERRLAAAKSATEPDPFRRELGAIGQWSMRDQIDDLWLSDQLVDMMRAGFVPTDAFSVVTRLETISTRHVDQAVAVLASLLMNPRVDRWAYMTQREPIRAVLANGLANGTAETIARSVELIGFLSSIGETSYLILVPAPAAE
jgi:hypothetical protein